VNVKSLSISLNIYKQFKKLSGIDTIAIDELYEFCSKEGLSPATIKIVHSVLNQAFKKAVKWKLKKLIQWLMHLLHKR
jgi:Phage integrase SAM-like domain